ncbi:MAG: hypothetical protein QOK23_2740 [Gammaproteobacteria bacterium]|jgi:hypothetical protein|nr:hypothetical protein [Gammaproteobacteria bacterium]
MVAQLQSCRSITQTYFPRFVSWPRHHFLRTTEDGPNGWTFRCSCYADDSQVRR